MLGNFDDPRDVGRRDGAAERDAAQMSAREPYDVLIVGGGPAGAAAAIYAARKGIRTAIVGERFGGQVLDTLAIENFISVKATDGPKLAAALEEHVREYDVDIINLQSAAALHAALTMPQTEQRDRMRLMRALIREFNVYRWAGRMLLDAASMRVRGRLMDRKIR